MAFRRSKVDFVTISENGAKHYKVEIFGANFVHKMRVSDNVVGAIEKTSENPSQDKSMQRRYFQSLSRSSWTKELDTSSFHKRTHSKTASADFFGTNTENSFHIKSYV